MHQHRQKCDQKGANIVQNGTLEHLGGSFGAKSAQGNQICSPGGTILGESGSKMEPALSQTCSKNRLKINVDLCYAFWTIWGGKTGQNSAIIDQTSISERMWTDLSTDTSDIESDW